MLFSGLRVRVVLGGMLSNIGALWLHPSGQVCSSHHEDNSYNRCHDPRETAINLYIWLLKLQKGNSTKEGEQQSLKKVGIRSGSMKPV